VRVRWAVADEDRHQVDREAIRRALNGAADIQLEGRVVPIVRSRAAGISKSASLADKVRAWCKVAGVNHEPLLDCLTELACEDPSVIAAKVLAAPMSETNWDGTPARDEPPPSVTSVSDAGRALELF